MSQWRWLLIPIHSPVSIVQLYSCSHQWSMWA